MDGAQQVSNEIGCVRGLARDRQMTRFVQGAAGAALVAMALVVAVFWPTPLQLWELWSNTDRPYSHGLLLGPLALWFAIRACWRAPPMARVPSVGALVLFATAGLVWLGAFAIHVLAAQLVLFPALLLLAAAAAGGRAIASRLVFPATLIYFAVPVWEYAVPLLQNLTIGVTNFVLDVGRVPVYVEGNIITVPEGAFEIAGGCAGLHYFIVALTISTLYGHLNFERARSRVLFVAIAAVVAAATNWVRVSSLVVIGHVTKMQHYLIVEDHYYYGWVLFALALGPLLFIGRAIANREAAVPRPNVDAPPPIVARGSVTLVVPALLVFVSVVFGAAVLLIGDDEAVESFEVVLPPGEGGWRLLGLPRDDWRPRFVGVQGEAVGTYVRGENRVDVYIGVYRSQGQGRELISSENRVLGEGYSYEQPVARLAPNRLDAIRYVEERSGTVRGGGSKRLAWSWYAIGDRMVVGDLRVKLHQVARDFFGNDSGSIVAVSVTCPGECSADRDMVEAFAAVMGVPLTGTAIDAQRRASHELVE